MELDYQAIGMRIRKERMARNLTQDNLAEKTGLSNIHISHIETGSTKLSLPALLRIADVLNISPDVILSGVAYQSKNVLHDALAEMITDCNSEEIRFIIEVVETVKKNIRKIKNVQD